MRETSRDRWTLRCTECSSEQEDRNSILCQACGGLLEFAIEDAFPTREQLFDRDGTGIWRFGASLPLEGGTAVSLGEGNTPLVRSVNLRGAERVELYIKNEGQNPTGSFKDRGLSVAVSNAKVIKARTLICASTGNTSASASAYAARANMNSVVLVPSGKIASGKLMQAVAHGAKVVRVQGNFDDSMKMVLDMVKERKDLYLVNSANPFRIEGQKTAAYEVFWQLGEVPDYVVLPVGNAGNISAYWKGFAEMLRWGITERAPKMIGVQASGAAPIADAFMKSREKIEPLDSPETVASAIRIGNPISWRKAIRAVKESNGLFVTVTDAQIQEAQKELAQGEGLFVEPASAAPVAAMKMMVDGIERGARVVCVATGNGLKDPSAVKVNVDGMPLASDMDELRKLIQF